MLVLNLHTSKSKEKIKIPLVWSEIPYFHYCEIIEKTKQGVDVFELAEIFTGCPAQTFRNTRAADFQTVQKVMQDLLTEKIELKKPLGKVKIKNTLYSLPKIESITAGQFHDIEAILKKKKSELDLYPLLLSIIFQIELNKEYDFGNVEKDAQIFREMSCIDVLNLGNFFLTNITNYWNGTTKNSPKLVIQLRNLGQVIRSWAKGLVRSTK